MIAHEIISESIPPLKVTDTGEKALQWINEFHVYHLPVIKGQKLLGVIAEEEVLDLEDPSEALKDQDIPLLDLKVTESQHIYEIIKIVADNKLSLVPVTNENGQYQGVITLQNLVNCMAQLDSIVEPGGILVLEMDLHDYSLTEIARHIEENNALILSNYVQTKADQKIVEVTLKINTTDLRHITATLERFNFRIKQSFQAEDMEDVLKERYDSLMKYLDV
jgi:CBS domain-containing protein